MIDPRYITAIDLNPYFVDKTTGAPLAGGVVSFYEDDSRATPKLVYALTGAPPNYTYTALPNPIILSSTGTFMDGAGNDIAVYYFPYDSHAADANIQLYYITVKDALGTQQFTREGWPNISSNVSQTINQANISNQLTNPQFVTTFFDTLNTMTATLAGAGNLSVNIAPGWTLNVTAINASNVIITKNPITGVQAYPYNPPYTLTVTPSANITSLTLSQRLYHNPSIWSPQTGASTNGYVSTSVLLAPAATVVVNYVPSGGVSQQIYNKTNNLGVYQQLDTTVQLNPAANPDLSTIGYVDIVLVLPTNAATTFSNVQVVTLEADINNIAYEQTPVNRQVDQTFNYYSPRLQYKPISSYLVGWDFPQNPAQFLGSTVLAQAVGANKSFYAWDQTIVFQNTNSGVSIDSGLNGEFILTSTSNNTQSAVIQYLDGFVVLEMLNSGMSCAIESKTSHVGGITATISLWYCLDANLPSVATGNNNSLIATIDANGHPVTLNGTWVEVTRNGLGNAQFTVNPNATTNFNFDGFSGWNLNGSVATQTATFFAAVVGFGPMPLGSTISINSISVVPGDIPTRPAYKPIGQTYFDCGRYYQKSFPINEVPKTQAGQNNSVYFPTPNGALAIAASSPAIFFEPEMRAVPNMVIYNPVNNNNVAYDNGSGADATSTSVHIAGVKTFNILFGTDAGCVPGNSFSYHWTADARLGIV